MDMDKLLEVGFAFHGHRCPAMPLGLKAALAAMEKLGVSRAQDKELHVISETGKGHAAGCFLDGIMVATGCTYGKSNIEKLYHNKLAFTLVDLTSGRSVRAVVRPEFLEAMIESPFVRLRKEGVPPQDIDPEIADPLINRVLSLPVEEFLILEDIKPYSVQRGTGDFTVVRCESCGEAGFASAFVRTDTGYLCKACH